MALVKIASAEVTRLIPGYGFKAASEIKLGSTGDTKKEYYTVWTDAKVQEGQVVEITGALGVKIEEFTGRDGQPKTVAAIHVNDAKVVLADAPF
jgi:hypothetical protein